MKKMNARFFEATCDNSLQADFQISPRTNHSVFLPIAHTIRKIEKAQIDKRENAHRHLAEKRRFGFAFARAFFGKRRISRTSGTMQNEKSKMAPNSETNEKKTEIKERENPPAGR